MTAVTLPHLANHLHKVYRSVGLSVTSSDPECEVVCLSVDTNAMFKFVLMPYIIGKLRFL